MYHIDQLLGNDGKICFSAQQIDSWMWTQLRDPCAVQIPREVETSPIHQTQGRGASAIRTSMLKLIANQNDNPREIS